MSYYVERTLSLIFDKNAIEYLCFNRLELLWSSFPKIRNEVKCSTSSPESINLGPFFHSYDLFPTLRT